MPSDQAVLVLDLDETVLRINSFPAWAKFLIIGRMPGLRLRRRSALSVRATAALLLRKFGPLNHAALARRLHVAWRAAIAGRIEPMAARFECALLRQVRPSLRPVLAAVACGHVDALLATAASSDYAVGLGSRLGFRHVLASFGDTDAGRSVNSGPRKRDRVIAVLKERGWAGRPVCLFTDHLDDLPLMQVSQVVCWFGPPEALPAARAKAAGAHFVACRDLGADQMVHTLSALCPPLGQAETLCAITES